ncbi:MAG: hypothetical protein WAK40_02735 [Thermoplasmata archaeon]
MIVPARAKSHAGHTPNFGFDPIAREGERISVGRNGQNGTLDLCTIAEFDPSFSSEPREFGIPIHRSRDVR